MSKIPVNSKILQQNFDADKKLTGVTAEVIEEVPNAISAETHAERFLEDQLKIFISDLVGRMAARSAMVRAAETKEAILSGITIDIQEGVQ